MRNLIIVAIFFTAFSLPCVAEVNYSASWDKGNDYYHKKIYDSAAYYFEQIAALKPARADVYYNLGNTYYRLNKIGPAVLNYERALKIDPNYKEAKDNLLLTQIRINNHIQMVGDIFFVNWWNSMTRQDKATTWAVVAFIAFLLIIAGLFLRRFNKPIGSHIPVQSIFILGIFWLFSIILAIIASNKSVLPTNAVVMQNETPLMNTDLIGKPITIIPEGTTVAIISDKGRWLEVRLPDGRTGYLQGNLVEKI